MTPLNQVILQCAVIFTTPVFSQFDVNTGMRPDVTFGDHNDRFDMTSLIDYQNKYFRADGSIDYRRKHGNKKRDKLKPMEELNSDRLKAALRSRKARKKLAKKIRRETEQQINSLANSILLRINSMRRNGEADGVERGLRDADGKENDLNDIPTRFKTVPTRRLGASEQKGTGYRKVGTDPDLFNYAFPIDMKVEGYLVAPEAL